MPRSMINGYSMACVSIYVCIAPPPFPSHRRARLRYLQEPGFSRKMRLGFALLPADSSRVRSCDTMTKPPLQHLFNHRNADFGYPRCWLRSEVLYGDVGQKYMTEHGEEEVCRVAMGCRGGASWFLRCWEDL